MVREIRMDANVIERVSRGRCDCASVQARQRLPDVGRLAIKQEARAAFARAIERIDGAAVVTGEGTTLADQPFASLVSRPRSTRQTRRPPARCITSSF